jgi:4-amino-4-deoxychorismate lyase
MIGDLPRDVVVLVNGAPPGASVLLGRGLHYGDGVFRTLLRFEGHWLDFDRHYVKLVQDCRLLGLDPPHVGQLEAELGALGGGRTQPAVGKIILARSGGGRGYAPQGRQVDRILLRHPAPRFAASCWAEGVVAMRSPVTLSAQPLLAGAKHLNRLENVLAARQWPAGVQEALLADAQGRVVCGSRSNVFWARNGKLFTPALRQCGVAGVMRAKLFDAARANGLEVELAEAPWAELFAADEVLMCNSLIGIWPIRRIDDTSLTAPGPLTRRLQAALAQPQLLE